MQSIIETYIKSANISFNNYFTLTNIIGTPTNVRTTNVGNDKRQNDKRQKGQT